MSTKKEKCSVPYENHVWDSEELNPHCHICGLLMREKPLSDKQVEMMWLKTDDGRMEIKLKYVLRSLEKLMAAIKSSLVNATMEARNI